MKEPFLSRLNKLRCLLEKEHTDALFCSSATVLNYLIGFKEPAYERLRLLGLDSTHEPLFLSPSLSELSVRNNPAGLDNIITWQDGTDPVESIKRWAKEWGLNHKRIAIDNDMSAGFLMQIMRGAPDAEIIPGATLLNELRIFKDTSEIDALQQAGSLTDAIFPTVMKEIKPGVSEKHLADVIENEFRQKNSSLAFDTIVAVGENSAKPHHMTGDRIVQQGDIVLLDYGARLNDYNGDTTKMVSLGKADPKAHEVYKVVLSAHYAAREAIKPGVPCEAVDKAARDVIVNAGYGDYFIHRTGHGIGLEPHEEPYIVKGNKRELREGMCCSIEPGIYLSGQFGIRIENIVTVTAAGHHSFNEEPPETLIEL